MSEETIIKIESVIDYIETHLNEKLTLDTIAAAIHYSKYHLSRLFLDTVGLHINEYIKRRQLTEAAKLLIFSEKPIIDIALLCGYQSQQAFSSAFKSMYRRNIVPLTASIPYNSSSPLKKTIHTLSFPSIIFV